MAREFLRIINETAYGTPATATTKNTDYILVELSDSNAYTMRETPVQQFVKSADGMNRKRRLLQAYSKFTGGLKTHFYPEQAAFLAPLLTVGTGTDLPSVTIDHVVVEEGSNTKIYTRHTGVKVTAAKISGNPEQQYIGLDLTLIGKSKATITVTDFAEPAASAYPSGLPYLFTNLTQTIGTSRTEIASWEVDIKNMVDAPFFESQYITRAKWAGSEVNLATKLVYKGNTDRVTYLAGTPLTVTAALNNGTVATTFDLKGTCVLTSVEDDLSMDKIYFQSIGVDAMFDTTATTDLTITVV